MLEEIENLISDPNFQAEDAIPWSRHTHEVVMSQSKDQRLIFFTKLFNIFNTKPEVVDGYEWERTRFYVYSMIFLSIEEKEFPDVPKFSLDTQRFGPLFYLILHMCYLSGKNIIHLNQFNDAFNKITEDVLKSQSDAFYSLSSTYYAKYLVPCYYNIERNIENKRNKVISIFRQLIIRPRHVSESELAFVSGLIRLLHILNDKKPSKELIAVVEYLLKMGNNAPSSFIISLFSVWFKFLEKTTPSQDQIDLVIKLFKQITEKGLNDLSKFFPSNLLYFFEFYKMVTDLSHQSVLINSLVSIFIEPIRADFPQEHIFSFIDNLSKGTRVVNRLIYGSFYHFTEFFILSIGYHAVKLRSIKCIKSSTYMGTSIIYFKDQVKDIRMIRSLDSQLYSHFPYDVYDDLNQADNVFEENLKKYETVWKSIKSILIFLNPLLNKFIELFSERNDDFVGQSNFSLYYRNILKAWFKMIVILCHRVMLLQQSQAPKQSKYVRNLYEYKHLLLAWCEQFLKKLNEPLMTQFTQIFAEILFKSTKKDLLSLNLLQTLQEFSQNSTFNQALIYQMMYISIENMNLLNERSYRDAQHFKKWFFFIVRFAGQKYNGSPNPFFAAILKYNMSIFVKQPLLFYSHNISSQKVLLDIAHVYLEAIRENTTQNEAHSTMKIKPNILEDYFDFLVRDVAPIILDPTLELNLESNLPLMTPILREAFLAKNDEVAQQAIEIVLKCLKGETQESMADLNKENYRVLFKNYFDFIKRCKKDSALRLIRSVPKLKQVFIQPRTYVKHFSPNDLITPYGIPLIQILNRIEIKFGDNEEYAAYLLGMLATIVEEVPSDHFSIPTLTQYLLVLGNLIRYDSVKTSVGKLFNHLPTVFKSCYFNYLVSLTMAAGKMKSKISQYLLERLNQFVKENKSVLSNTSVSSIIYSIFKSSTASFNQFPLLISLSIFLHEFPGSIKPDHLYAFFSIPKSKNDSKLLPLFKKFMKEFVQTLSYEEKQDLLVYFYYHIDTLPFIYSHMCFKHATKLGIPLPFTDLSHLNTKKGADIFYYRTALTIACGIQGHLEITKDLIYQSIQLARPQQGINNRNLLFTLPCFCIAVLKNPTTAQFLRSDMKMLKEVFYFIMATIQAPYLQQQSEKALKILLNNFIDCECIYQQVDQLFARASANELFFLKEGKAMLNQIQQMTKYCPNRCPQKYIKDFMHCINEYLAFSKEDKLKHFINFMHILKFVTIKPFITSDPIRSELFSPYKETTCFNFFLHANLQLFLHPDIPYEASCLSFLIKFCSIFKEESTKFLIYNNHKDEVQLSFEIMEKLIFKKQEFFNIFFATISKSSDWLSLNPNILKLIKHLGQSDQYGKNEVISDFTKRFLNHMKTKNTQIIPENYRIIMYRVIQILLASIEKEFQPTLVTFVTRGPMRLYRHTPIYYKMIRTIYCEKNRSHLLNILNNLVVPKSKVAEEFEEMQPRSVDAFIGQTIKFLSPLPDNVNERLWDFFISQLGSKVTNASQNAIICITRLSAGNKPSVKHIPDLHKFLKDAFYKYDSFIIFKMLKLTWILQTKKMLLPDYYESVLRFIFSFTTFLEIPYCKYTAKLLQAYPYKTIKPALRDAFYQMVDEKLPAYKDFNKISYIIQYAPIFIKSLPFSFICCHIKQLQQYYRKDNGEKKQRPKDLDQMVVYFMQISIDHLDPSQMEFDQMCDFGFQIIKDVLAEREPASPLEDKFLLHLIKRHYSNFPTDLFPNTTYEVSSILIQKIFFEYICVSFLYCDAKFLIDRAEIIIMYLSRMANESLIPNPMFLVPVFQTVFQNDALFNVFWEPIQARVINQLFMSNSEIGIQKLTKILNQVLEYGQRISKINLLMPMWRIIDESMNTRPHTVNDLLKFMIQEFERIPYDSQLSYLQMILTHMKKHYVPLLSNYHKLIKSQSISNSVKVELLDKFIEFDYSLFKPEYVQSVYEELSNVNSIDHFQYKVILLMIMIIINSTNKRIEYADTLMSILDPDPHERLVQLAQAIPLRMWSNNYLPFTVLIVIGPQTKLWYSFMCFGEVLIQQQLKIFKEIMNEYTYPHLYQLLVSALSAENKNDYDMLVSLNIKFNINLPTPVVYKGLKLTDQYHLFNYSHIHDRLLLPHSLNDHVFGMLRKQFTIETSAAVAQFFLSNYIEADKVFNQMVVEKDPLIDRIRQLSRHFPIQPIERLSHPDHFMLPRLEKALQYIKSNAMDAATHELALVEQVNVLYIRLHAYPSAYERERAVTVQSIISATHEKFTKNAETEKPKIVSRVYTDCCLNPSFRAYLQKFQVALGLVSNIETLPEIEEYNGPTLIFPGFFSSLFSKVAGYSSRGFISVSPESVMQAANKLSILEKPSIEDLQRIPMFNFTLFTSSPTASFLYSALSSHINMLNNELEMPTFMRDAFTGRIITMIRLGINSSEDSMVQACQNATHMLQKNSLMFLRTWVHQILEIRWHTWFSDATQDIPKDLVLMSALFAREDQDFDKIRNSWVDNNRKSVIQLRALKVLKEFFDFLFSIDFNQMMQDRTNGNKTTDVQNFEEQLRQVNSYLPLVAPSRFATSVDQQVYRIHEDIRMISSDAFAFNAITQTKLHHPFIIQRIPNTPKAMSVSNALHIFKLLFKFTYQCQAREISLSVNNAFEAGPNYIFYPVTSSIKTLQEVYDSRIDFLESVKKSTSSESYFKLQNLSLRSFTTTSLIHHIFNIPTPTNEKVVYCKMRGDFPVVMGDILPNYDQESYMILCPSLQTLFGPSMKGKMALTLAAAAQAYIEHFETYRSMIEIIIGDELGEDAIKLDNLLEKRDEFDRRITQFASPQSRGSTPQDTVQWLSDIEQFIDRSMDPNYHDPQIPWF